MMKKYFYMCKLQFYNENKSRAPKRDDFMLMKKQTEVMRSVLRAEALTLLLVIQLMKNYPPIPPHRKHGMVQGAEAVHDHLVGRKS
jgi:hypothetical protein